ncbi:MAG: hypothetical protein LBT76_05470 [Tannerella sp.]|jgi:hypothetical protein|nr:hypothetical protein [Tannerella sp.]
MKRPVCLYGTVCLLALLPAFLEGQENRQWAIRYAADLFDKPFLTRNPARVSTGNGSAAFAVTGEYFLPDKWSLQAGYFRTEISYGDARRHMEGVRAGGRKYFLGEQFLVQPYLSAAGELNWGQGAEYREYSASTDRGDHTFLQRSVNPRLSFVPAAGAEIYLFSCIAFCVEYSLGMGIASRTRVEASLPGERPYALRDNGIYHSLSLGVKLTFPFTFTSDDGMTLFYLLTEALFPLLDHTYPHYY